MHNQYQSDDRHDVVNKSDGVAVKLSSTETLSLPFLFAQGDSSVITALLCYKILLFLTETASSYGILACT